MPDADHDFRLAHLRHGQPHGAGGELQAADQRALVRLGVGTQPQVVGAAVLPHAREVALHHVEVDEERGRIDFGDVHSFGYLRGRGVASPSVMPMTHFTPSMNIF